MIEKKNKIIAIIGLLILIFFGCYSSGSNTKDDFTEKKLLPLIDTSDELREGDLIFQTSTSSQSNAIQLATNSKYSHMGIIYKQNEKLYVYEAIQPVKLTSLTEWINRGQNRNYVVKRLKNAEQVLTPENLQRMKSIGEKFKNKNYDLYFEWSNERIYCSELVWKIYKEAIGIEIGDLEKLSDFDLSSKIVKQKITERFGNKIPLDENVISPSAMFNSEKLVTIIEK